MTTAQLRRSNRLVLIVAIPFLLIGCDTQGLPEDVLNPNPAGGLGQGGMGGGDGAGVGGGTGGSESSDSSLDPEESLHGGHGGGPVAEAQTEDSAEYEFCPEGALDEGLVGYWKFDEGAGSAVVDATGNGNDGVVVEGRVADAGKHGVPQWRSGKVGAALKLDGDNDWVRVPASKSIDETGDLNGVSVSAWVNLERLNTEEDFNFVVLRHFQRSRSQHFGLGMFHGFPASAVSFFFAIGPEKVPLGEWVHLAMTYDGITERIYLNGSEAAFYDIGLPIVADETPVTIGAATTDEFEVIENIAGLVDEVRLYNRELLPCEVNELALE